MDSSLLAARILYVIMWVIFIILIITIVSSIIALVKIDVTEYTVISEKIPDSFNDYKILQLSDLHNAKLGKNNSKILKEIEKIKPDIIVMTGDMINTNSKSYDNFFELAKEITKNYTTYYIMGNHEQRLEWKKQFEFLRQLKNIGVNVLENTDVTIYKNSENINLYGLKQPVSSYKNALKNNTPTNFSLEDMSKIFPAVNEKEFNILLSHSPFDFDIFSTWGADLTLSGHVHGGLIRLPFIGGVLSPERTFFPKYDAGEYVIGDSKMIVCRGLGNGTLPIRIFNNPEICVITLKNK